MLQPAMGNHPIGGRPWAADNGCFAMGTRFNVSKWLKFLKEFAVYQSTCLFAVAPDVVGDARATQERSAPFLPMIRQAGYAPAFVAQDGWDEKVIDWDGFNCLFIGGSTSFKLQRSEELANLAHGYGKWVHVGRVNSERRLRAMMSYGVDSVDGTYLTFGPRTNLPKLRGWFENAVRQPALL